MDLNKKQKRIIQIGIILIVLSVMFPPWRYEGGWTSAERPAGYYFVFGGVPKVKSQAEMREIFSVPDELLPATAAPSPIQGEVRAIVAVAPHFQRQRSAMEAASERQR